MEKHLKGSFTVEAAGVMAVILFGIGTIITEAGRKLGKGDPAPTLSPGNISAEDYIDRETGGRG